MLKSVLSCQAASFLVPCLEKLDSVGRSSVPIGVSGNLSGTQARIYEAKKKSWGAYVLKFPVSLPFPPVFKTITFKIIQCSVSLSVSLVFYVFSQNLSFASLATLTRIPPDY